MAPTLRRHATVASLVVAAAPGLSMVACAPDPPAAATQVEVTTSCRTVTELGAGILIDNGLVLTSAHVVAAASEITLRLGGEATTATVVAFDPDNDLAYLQPAVTGEHGWTLATRQQLADVERGDPASVYVTRDHEITRLDATIVRRVQIDTEDIYIDADVTRPGWEIRYPIEPGDSGGAVVANGVVIGVVWARSRQAADRAYAIDPVLGSDLIATQLETGILNGRDGTPIDFDRC